MRGAEAERKGALAGRRARPRLVASSPSPSLSLVPQQPTMLRGAQVKVLNRGALRAARKNAAVFNAARTLATKAASPAVLPKVLPRAASAAASREFQSHVLHTLFPLGRATRRPPSEPV